LSTRVEDIVDTNDIEFLKYIESQFDRSAYLNRYRDVNASDGDPLEHWLQHGLYEGRFFEPGMVAKVDANAAQTAGAHWRKFTWLGRDVAVRTRRFRDSFLKPIEAQALGCKMR